MPAVLAFQCPRTGKLFPSWLDYRQYLRNCARSSLDARALARKRAALLKTVAPLWLCSTFEEIEEWCCQNSETIFWFVYEKHQPYAIRTNKDAVKASKKFRITGLSFDVRWKDSCSNSHRAPEGGVTNWHHTDDKPTGYPGFHGRFSFDFENDPFGFDLLRELLVKTGTASGGNKRMAGEVTLFADDWPSLAFRHALMRDQLPED